MYTPPPGATRLIGSTRLSGSAASIAFSSIPQSYTHLQLWVSAQTTHTSAENILLRFNSDSGNNYHWQIVQASNTSVTGTQALLTSSIVPGSAVHSSATARPASCTVFIPEYAKTNFHKTAMTMSGRSIDNTSILLQNFYGHWNNTAAITTVSLHLTTGSFATGTVATLYGLV